MDRCFVTFRSVTFAQRGEQILKKAGIGCRLQRTPKWMEEQGCGYCLVLEKVQLFRAAERLRQAQVPFRKLYLSHGDGALEEVAD